MKQPNEPNRPLLARRVRLAGIDPYLYQVIGWAITVALIAVSAYLGIELPALPAFPLDDLAFGTRGTTNLGDLELTGALTAGTGVTATTGGVTATAGGLTATAGGLTVTAGGATIADGGLTLSDDDLVVADDLRVTAQTAITVTNGAAFTPTGTYQPIQAAEEVTPTLTAGATAGDLLVLINTSDTTINLADGGTLMLTAAGALGQYDSLTLWSDGTNWIEIGRANN
jgi:hypothetical protein